MFSQRLFQRVCVLLLLTLTVGSRAFAAEAPKAAPDFTAPDLSGKTQTLSAYRGRIVVLNFWATWCPECIHELPSLNAFAEANKDVVVLAIASERNPETVRNFLASSPAKYPVIVDSSGDIFVKKYLVRALPSTVIVDQNGNIADRVFGAENFLSKGFQERIKRLQGTK
ncbi:MAG: TlpA disulfide reductase family protein [Nitrospiraceae bacterium]|nr:TlpA disulfide reductase family protein [Nitrospiraceae bacterium]